jgi:hypothetical protein
MRVVNQIERQIRERQVTLQVPTLYSWIQRLEIEVDPIGMKSPSTAEI